jgi:hypothetical protein
MSTLSASSTLYVCLCVALAFTSWCRLVHSTTRTPEPVRLGFVVMAVAAAAAAIAPWAYGWAWLGGLYPRWGGASWPQTCLVAAVLLVQLATARFWSPKTGATQGATPTGAAP